MQEEKNLREKHSQIGGKINFVALSHDIKEEYGISLSSETLRRKAIQQQIHVPKQKKTKIYREVKTTKIGRLFQHDASFHKWSPFMEKFYLILTIDDASRMIVGARFGLQETTMEHILEVESVCTKYGVPLNWYTDKHSIFTYTERKSGHSRYNFQTVVDDAEVQWKRVMNLLQVRHILANSPQAKGNS